MSTTKLRKFQSAALLLLVAIFATVLGLLFGSSNSAIANTYTYSGQGGVQPNESSIKIHYIWGSAGDRISLGVEGPLNLEAVWTNTATSEFTISPIANRSSTTSTVAAEVKTPVNTWASGTKVELEIRAKSGASDWGLNGINNSSGIYTASNQKMWEVLSLGNFPTLTRLTYAFQSTGSTLRVSAALPSTVRDLSGAFASATGNPDVTGWDTSQVTNMYDMFRSAANFNQNIGGWNTASVSNMAAMFYGATTFSQNIGTWNTGAVTTMRLMFAATSNFNQNLSAWDVSKVTDMSSMFDNSPRFNNGDPAQVGAISSLVAGTKPLSWSTSSLTNVAYMFRGAKGFNQNINAWDVSKVTNFSYMFAGGDTSTTYWNGTAGMNLNDQSTFFNNGGAGDSGSTYTGSAPLWSARPPGSGTGTSAIDMSFMFSGAQFFNQDISSWNTSYVTSMAQMFEYAGSFNNGDRKFTTDASGSNTFNLSTSRVVTFEGMFFNATAFNQDISNWDVSAASNLRYMLGNNYANPTNGSLNAAWFNNGDSNIATTSNTMSWLASGSTQPTVDMYGLFYNNPYFNQDLSGWNVSAVTDISYMFYGNSNFNNGQGSGAAGVRPLSWNTSQVQQMVQTFNGAGKFNQNLDTWDTSKVRSFSGMFTSAWAFNNGKTALAGGSMPWRTNAGTTSSMANMFNSALAFNQNISAWNTQNVTDMSYMFFGASGYNNGQPSGTAGGADLTFSTSNVTNMSNMFRSATVFNQNVSNFDTSKVTRMDSMFDRAPAFNNGQTAGEAGQRPLTWTTSNVTTIASMFLQTANAVFNQNVSGWDLSKCTDFTAAFVMSGTDMFNNGALAGQSNSMSWTLPTSSSVATVNMSQLFQSLGNFNADITGWNTSRVTNMFNMFHSTGSFNQDISGWNTSRVTDFSGAFRNSTAFNQDISSWNVSSASTLANMFDGAQAFNQNLASFQLTSLANSGLVGIFGTTTSAITEENIQHATIAWSHQSTRAGFPTVGTYDAFGKARWLNCVGYAGYQRMILKQAMTTWATLGSAPTGCSTATVSWYGASTGSPTTQSISIAPASFTPDAATSTTGVAPRYVVLLRGTAGCRVNNLTGVISYTSSGSCTVRAYDVAPTTNGDVTTYKDVAFVLPTPSATSTPSAPTTLSAISSISSLTVTFSAPASNGGLPLTGYEVGYALTSGGTPTWVSVSPVVTSSSTLSYTLSGLVNGTSYWLKVRAINQLGAGAASAEFGPVTPATTPSAPSILSSPIANSTVTLNLSAPSTNGGAAITSYEYRFATSSAGVLSASWTNSATTSTTITVSGLVNGNSYYFQVRAVNSIGGGGATAVTSALTPITTSSPPVIYLSNKVGYQTTAEIQFFAPSSTGGSAILDYQVRSSTNEGDTWSGWSTQAATFDVNAQRWYMNLSGLQGDFSNLVYYTFEIRARNAAGYSSPALQVPSGAPITSVNFGNQQAIVNFKAAKYNGNSTIVGYEYQYRTGTWINPLTVSAWISISPTIWNNATTTTAVSVTVSGLTNGLGYNFGVRAVNAIGGDTRPYWNWVDSAGTPNKPVPTITFSYGVSTPAYSESASYSPTISSVSTGNITFSTSTPSKCSVATLSGVVTNLNVGLCTIQLSQAESDSYSATTVLRYISPTAINQPTLQISTSATSSPYLGTVTLTTTGGGGTGAVTYTAVVGSACVVSGNVVTVGNAGSSCAVVASKASDGNYLAASSTQLSISTTKINQSALTFSSLAELAAKSSMSVSAIGGSGEGVLRYRVSNAGTTGCVLTGTTLTATSAGQCTIEASRAGSTNYTTSASVSQVIEVVKSSQTIRFTTNVPSEPLVGSTYSPSATASSGLSISYIVSGSGCSITLGTISFTAAGDCKVEASQAGDGAFLAGPTASQTIAVGRRNHTLAFTTASQAISTKTFGDQAFILAANSTEPGALVAFTLSPQTTNDACSVFSSGLVVVLNVGDCVVEAYSTQTQALAAASTISKRIEIRADRASAPFITSVAMGNLSITAAFTPPSYIGGSTISAYTIVAIDQTPNSSTEISDSSCGTTLVSGRISCRINGLENGKNYKIKVAAVNGAGEGEFSILSPAITVATNPAAVQNLKVIQGASTLAISWDDPDSLGGGTFSSYRVYVKRSSTTSYDADHYFNVVNQNTRNITISAETPPDGMTHPGGPALVNGVAYDIKVVTVTSANTQELTGNTAVVNQIPRTVPEPPRLATALVVANKLVLTWTAPLSDGGAAITTYSASVGQSPCVFAAPDDTYCEIALPTTPGDYVFSIAAQNIAGSSTQLQGTYTVAAYNSPSSQPSYGSGGSDVLEPAKPSESAPIVSGIQFSSDKTQIVIRGLYLKGIKKIVIGGIEAVIVSQTTEMIILRSPVLKSGSHSVFLHMTDNTVLKYEKDLVIEVAKPTVVTKKSTLSGFKPGTSVLTAQMKRDLLEIFKANKQSKSLLCVGHTQGPTILKVDARLAMRRANAVCNFAKQNGIKLVSSSYQNNKQVGAKYRRVDLIFTK